MTTPATTTTSAPAPTPAPAAAQGNTIHDAVAALFAEKAAKQPETLVPEKQQEVATAEGAGNQPETAQPGEQLDGETPPADDKPTEPASEPKVSAADYALQLARTKKKLAVAEAAARTAKPAEPTPSAEALKRAAAIEAAGGDPLKMFEAAGLDLATVVQAYDNKQATDPDYPDPLAKEVKELRKQLLTLQQREEQAREAEAVASFMSDAQKRVSSGDKYEYVAAHGQNGLELVKELVLESARAGKTLKLDDALQLAEEHYNAEAETLAKTKKLAKKFQSSQTRKPGIAQQAPVAGAAPATQTKPKSVRDVINQELDALMG